MNQPIVVSTNSRVDDLGSDLAQVFAKMVTTKTVKLPLSMTFTGKRAAFVHHTRDSTRR